MNQNIQGNSSLIWKIPSKKFAQIVQSCNTWADLSRKFYKNVHNVRTLKNRVKQEKIDTSHFLGRSKYKGMKCDHNKRFKYCLEDLLVDSDHKIPNQRLKEKLIDAQIFTNQCYICGIHDEWNGMPLVLQLVHVNGNSYDNRIENLLLLCPNCSSQLSQQNSIFLNSCRLCDCNIPEKNTKRLCKRCDEFLKSKRTPSKEVLYKELVQHGFDFVQQKYQLSKEDIITCFNKE